MLGIHFATAVLLLALWAIPLAVAALLFAHLRKRQLLARFAAPLLLSRHTLVRPGVRRWNVFCVLAALSLTAIACAGPQWGVDPAAQVRRGRDVVLVLDLSRSMNAEQPSRRDRALKSLRDLGDAFEEHGGNRIALVTFASRARLVFPFTQDCDHLRHTLKQIETDDYPSLFARDAVSGTRLGAALQLAAQSCEREHAHEPVLVLLSDGDDPADDEEWRTGVQTAIAQKIPVHVVGIGNPDKAETIPHGNDLLRYEGEIIRTRLNEARLRDIAQQTGGMYLPARRQAIPLGTFVLHLLDAEGARAGATSADALPVYQLRYAWFLLPAVLLLMIAMMLNEGPNVRPVAAAVSRTKRRAFAAVAASASLFLVSAADPPEIDTLIRQGDDAFARQQYDAALEHYGKAEALTQDPGRLSFNKAAAYYRSGRYRDVVECYRRALEDDTMPPERRAHACYNLGNALVQQADGDAEQLQAAVKAYRAALYIMDAKAEIRKDAAHNLELAQLLLNTARRTQPEKVRPKNDKAEPKKEPDEKDPQQKDKAYVPVDPSQDFKPPEKSDKASMGKKSDQLQPGAIQVIPERDKATPLSPADTWATLEDHARRIAQERRQQRNPSGPGQLSTKDW